MENKDDSKLEDLIAKIEYSSKSVIKTLFRYKCKRLDLSPQEASKKLAFSVVSAHQSSN